MKESRYSSVCCTWSTNIMKTWIPQYDQYCGLKHQAPVSTLKLSQIMRCKEKPQSSTISNAWRSLYLWSLIHLLLPSYMTLTEWSLTLKRLKMYLQLKNRWNWMTDLTHLRRCKELSRISWRVMQKETRLFLTIKVKVRFFAEFLKLSQMQRKLFGYTHAW